MIYIYGELEGVDGIKANPLFKNATLVYTDDKEVGANYKKLGVEVKPIIKTVVPKTTKK